MTFPSSLLTYQAAVDGPGVAIGQLPLLQEELASGTLVRPLPQTLWREPAYYLVEPEGRQPGPSLRRFREWLLSQW